MNRDADWAAVLSDVIKETSPDHPLVREYDAPRRIPMRVGDTVLVRTVTYHAVGVVAAVAQDEVFLHPAAWVAESARWTHSLLTGELREVEPFPDGVVVSRDAMVDWTRWRHDVPSEPIPGDE